VNQDIPVDQHTVGQSLLLHLVPGVLIGMCYFALSPVLGRAGYPSLIALMIAFPVVLVPVELGYLLYQGRKRNGRVSLRGVVLYRTPIPVWQYFAWVPALFVGVGAVFTLLKPVDSLLRQQVFAWLPALQSGLDGGYGKTALILTYAMVAIFGAFLAPIVEELYFRGWDTQGSGHRPSIACCSPSTTSGLLGSSSRGRSACFPSSMRCGDATSTCRRLCTCWSTCSTWQRGSRSYSR
jgi:membrane protease YdiL (CAAX protease family)